MLHVKSAPTVSVVIPTYNRRDVLLLCLQHLADQKCDPGIFEVIVVSDGSIDGTVQALAECHYPFSLIVLEQQNRGAAAARNHGASRASGELLLFLDDDIFAGPDLIAEHVRAHQNQPGGVVVGPTPVSSASPPSPLVLLKREFFRSDIDRLTRLGFNATDPYHFVGPNVSLSKELFQQHNGFDESLRLECDDVELGLRLLEAGVRFSWNPAAQSEQYFVKPVSTYSGSDRYQRALNEGILVRRHPRYRSISLVSDLFVDSWLKRSCRKILVAAPWIMAVPVAILKILGAQTLAFRIQAAASFWKVYKKNSGNPFEQSRLFDARVPILNYHVIRDDLPPDDVVMSVGKFRQQILYLKKHGFHGITLQDWHDWVLSAKTLPEKPVIITFDDGFLDCYQNAFPILKENGFPFTLFLVTEKLGTTNEWDGIAPGQLPLLSLAQAVELKRNGVSLQAHSCTHTSFRKLDSNQLAREINECRTQMLQFFGSSPDFFAYPYGFHSAQIRKMVSEAGYRAAVTTIPGINTLKTDMFRLRRIGMSGKDSLLAFSFKLRFGYGIFHWQELKKTLRVVLGKHEI